jgi:hypothetical protein
VKCGRIRLAVSCSLQPQPHFIRGPGGRPRLRIVSVPVNRSKGDLAVSKPFATSEDLRSDLRVRDIGWAKVRIRRLRGQVDIKPRYLGDHRARTSAGQGQHLPEATGRVEIVSPLPNRDILVTVARNGIFASVVCLIVCQRASTIDKQALLSKYKDKFGVVAKDGLSTCLHVDPGGINTLGQPKPSCCTFCGCRSLAVEYYRIY